MDELDKKGLIVKETRKSRLSNVLVIVVAAEGGAAIESAKDLAGDKVKRLALAEPKTIPAGIYAREYLQKQHLWAGRRSKSDPDGKCPRRIVSGGSRQRGCGNCL